MLCLSHYFNSADVFNFEFDVFPLSNLRKSSKFRYTKFS